VTSARSRRSLPALIGVLVALALALAMIPAAAAAAKPGTLTQLPGKQGCLVDASKPAGSCGKARALKGPGPFMGSRAIAVSPDGKNIYVASSSSDAIAIFLRDKKTGVLSQAPGKAGCVSAKGLNGCAIAAGLDEPNSVAVSPDGKSVYATSRAGNSLTSYLRNPKNGALHQLPPERGGCLTALPIVGCAPGRALVTPDVVVVSPDGKNVYAGAFFGNSVASFARDASTGGLAQLAGSAGCIAEATEGCATGIGLKSVEGLAISGDGASVYAATALSNAVVELSRDASTGALTQATDGSGCIVDAALTGCTLGRELAGANAVAISPDDGNVYVTSLFSNSVTSFNRAAPATALVQKEGTSACLIFLRSAGCSFGRAMVAPEGLAVSPDGKNVYVASFKTGAIDVLNRGSAGAVAQKPGTAGCLASSVNGCAKARALKGVSSIALSPDGRYLYSTSFESNAVDVFRRNK
jgi:DNA-binding beta-propeller fold protein YncE